MSDLKKAEDIKAKIAQLEAEKKHLIEQLSEIEEEPVPPQIKPTALPSSQKDAILQGNTVFIDDNFSPYADQWGFLSGLKKMTITDAEKISDKTPENNQITGNGECRYLLSLIWI